MPEPGTCKSEDRHQSDPARSGAPISPFPARRRGVEPLGLDVYTARIYTPQAFEWDSAKRETNLRKHGVDFARAVRIFEAPVLERQDRRRDYGEPRFVALGAVEELLLAVVYTPRELAFRIISAGNAHRHEKAAYRQVQSPKA